MSGLRVAMTSWMRRWRYADPRRRTLRRSTAGVVLTGLAVLQFVQPSHAAAVARSAMPSAPLQQSGTAAGRPHAVPASATAARNGAIPGTEGPDAVKGAIGRYAAQGTTSAPTDSGSRVNPAPTPVTQATTAHGFDPSTSVEQPNLDTANTVVYKNADGTYTAQVHTSPVNVLQPDGSWARVASTPQASTPQASTPQASTPQASTPQAVSAATDPAGQGNASAATYVESGVTQNFDGNGALYVGQYLGNNYNTFLQFSGFNSQFTNAYVVSATLELDTEYSGLTGAGGTCSAQPVNVAAISGSWNPATINTYPGPAAGAQIASATFSAGADCPNGRAWEGIPLPVSTLMNWAHGWAPNYGLALTAPLTSQAAKEFYANDPYLAITYTPNGEGAAYSEISYASPWNNQAGWGEVTVQNRGSATWTPANGFKLSYELYTVSGSTKTLLTSPASTPQVMPNSVAPNQPVTVTASIPALTPGPTYQICWDMINGTTTFSSLGVSQTCYSLPVVNNPPIIDSFSPGNNANEFSLTPTLGVAAHDPDNYPGKGLLYSFKVYKAGSTTALASATNLSTATWTVPSGVLSWAGTYYWTAQVSDTLAASLWSAPDYFTIPSAQQPLLTSHLGAAPFDSTIKGIDPAVGDYSTVATDADNSQQDFGPMLRIQRTYNSSSPSTYGAFGAGWSSVLDMRATPDSDGSGSVVVTLPDGRQERFGSNGNGTFSPPAGVVAALTAPLPGFGSGGYTLVDQSGNRYLLGMPETDPVTGQSYFGLTNAWDVNGHGIDLHWMPLTLTLPSGATVTASEPTQVYPDGEGQNGINGNTTGTPYYVGALGITWGVEQITSSTGAKLNVPHVVSVASGNSVLPGGSSVNPWTYAYDASNDLTTVCPPVSATATSTSCTRYAYTSGASSGSHFASMVLDSDPTAYWRLGDASGATAAADSVAANEGSKNGVPHNVTFGPGGALAGTPATSASFNGTSSYLGLPASLVATSSNLTVGLWFRTTQAGGTLFSYQSVAPGTATSASYTPALYVGTDGKLRGEFWDGSVSPMASSTAVNDGKWHFAVLVGSRTNQTLFLDGAQVATRAGSTISVSGQPYTTVGAGELAGLWPDAPSGNALGYFSGQIEDVSFLQHPLGLPEVQQEYASGTVASAELTGTTLPSGKTQATVSYDTLADRATSVTDSDGGTFKVSVPATTGSDAYYSGAAMATRPAFDYPMTESSGLVASNDSGIDDPASAATDGAYNNVMLGEPGIFGPGGDSAAGFNGSSSYLSLPSGSFSDQTGNATVVLWFKTTTPGGVLFDYQSVAPGTVASANYTPALYVGADGKLHGEFYDGSSAAMATPGPVTDGNWHLAELAATGTSQTLYLDGQVAATRTGQSIAGYAERLGESTVTVGAGYVAGSWPSPPANPLGYFNGEIAQVGLYDVDIDQTTPDAAASLYEAKGSSSGLTPTATVTISDPGGNTAGYAYDAIHGNRLTAFTDALGHTTTYAYDTLGFQDATTDADGHTTSRLHDASGNVIAQTTCQSQSSCQTSYYGYYEDTANPLDPLNGRVLYAADARSGPGGITNPAYRTAYTYTANGSIASVTTPPTSDFPRGRTTSYTYYAGTETYTGPDGTQVTEPYGMLATTTDPRGEVTRYTYYSPTYAGGAGQLYTQIDPSGLTTMYGYNNAHRVASKCVISDSYPLVTTTGSLGQKITTCPEQWTYTYDPQGRPVTATDPATTDAVTGVTHTPRITTAYDADGDITSQSTADITGKDATRALSYTYNPGDRVATRTDSAGNTTSYTYDAFGNKTGQTDPSGTTYQYTYTPTGLQLTSAITNWVGDPTSPSSPATLVTDSRAYDPAGRLATDTDAMGRTTAYTYYDNGLIQSVTNASGTASAVVSQAFTYDAAGNKLTECDGQTSTGCAKLTRFAVDAASRPVQSTVDPSGSDLTTTDQFDADGHVLSQILAGGGQSRETSYTYDAAGDKLSATVANGTDGPAGFWPLTDGAVTQAADSSGHGATATVSGQVSWDAPGGNAATFDGSTGQVATSTPVVNTTGSYSVAAWVYLKATSTTNDYTAVSQDATSTSAFQLQYNHTSKGWALSMPASDVSSPTVDVATGGTAAAGTWTQVVGTYNALDGALTLYVNGTSVSGTTQVTNTTPVKSTGGSVIGRGKSAGVTANFFPGQIRNVQLFNRTLSGSEVTALYNSATVAGQAPISLGASAWWKLNDGEAAAAADHSGNGNAADLGGDSSWSADHGGALVTDGTAGGGAMTSGPVVPTAGSYTVSAWVNIPSIPSSFADVVAEVGTANSAFQLQYNTGHWAFTQSSADSTSATYAVASASAAPATRVWTHLVGEYNAAAHTVSLYVNGTLAGSVPAVSSWNASGPLTIGNSDNAQYLNGEISDVQVYNRALSASEITTLYTTSGTVGTAPSVTTWTYDQRGLPQTMTDPRGNTAGATAAAYTTSYLYDQAGQLTTTSSPPVTAEANGNPASQVVATNLTGYDTFGDPVETSDPDGNIITTTYDADGNQTAVSMPAYTPPGSATSITPTVRDAYDSLGRLASQTDARLDTTGYTYDQLGDQVQVVAPGNNVWHSTFDTGGEQLSVTDPTGAQTQATYDPLGRQITSSQVERSPSAAVYTTRFGYDALGRRTTTTDPFSNRTVSTYNPVGDLNSVTDPMGNTTRYAYNLAGQTTETIAAGGTATLDTYDTAGRLTSVAQLDASGSTLATNSNTYDAAGEQVSATDAMNNTTTVAYDALGRVVSQTQPASAGVNITTSFGYDAAGNLTRYTDPNGNATYYTYNPLGLRESQIDPSVAGATGAADRTTTTAYDAAGNPVTITQPGGVTVTNVYDANGNLASQAGAGAEAATQARSYAYDALGRPTSISAPGGTESITYDDRGLPVSLSGPAGAASYSYDADERVTSRTDATGVAGFSYNADSQIATQTDPVTGATVTYNYDNLTELSGIAYGTGGATRAYTYNPRHELTLDTLKAPTGTVESSISYGYNLDGQINAENTTGTAGAGSSTYTYDQAGRLTSWNNGSSSSSYGYDQAGNLTTDGGSTASYNARNELTSVTNGSSTTNYAYTSRGTTASVTSAGGTVTSYTGDAFNQQITAGSNSYSYDALGRLSSSTTNGSNYTFSYNDLSSNAVSDGVQEYGRGAGGSVLSEGAAGSSGSGDFVGTDAHGDVTAQFTPTGSSLAGSAAYSPWGQVTATGGSASDVGYQGGWTDPGTGTVNAHARWYNPANGDFTSQDPVSNAASPAVNANDYAYANDDPLARSDTSGHDACSSNDYGAIWARYAQGVADRAQQTAQTWQNIVNQETAAHAAWYTQVKAEQAVASAQFAAQMAAVENQFNAQMQSEINATNEYMSQSAAQGGAGTVTGAGGSTYSPETGPSQQWLNTVNHPGVGVLILGGLAGVGGYLMKGFEFIGGGGDGAGGAGAGAAEDGGGEVAVDILDALAGLALASVNDCGAGAIPTRPTQTADFVGAQVQGGAVTEDAAAAAAQQATSSDPSADASTDTIIDTVPDTRVDNRRPGTCLDDPVPGSNPNTKNGGWDYYEPTGYGDRSEGAIVCASMTNSPHIGADRPADWLAAKQMAALFGGKVQSCHLAPSVLGGSGQRANVAACWQLTNIGANSMVTFEREAANLVRDNYVVEYVGIPIYNGPTSTIPIGFELDYTAVNPATGLTASDMTYIPNDSNGAKPNLGN